MTWHVIPWYGAFPKWEQDYFNKTIRDIGENHVMWSGFRRAAITLPEPQTNNKQWAWGTMWRVTRL